MNIELEDINVEALDSLLEWLDGFDEKTPAEEEVRAVLLAQKDFLLRTTNAFQLEERIGSIH